MGLDQVGLDEMGLDEPIFQAMEISMIEPVTNTILSTILQIQIFESLVKLF